MAGKREIKNLKKAAERIKKAVEKKERIILYGDSDLDGVASVVILKETIQNLGGQVTAVFFPDRENDGYGITKKGLKDLEKFAPALFVSMDLGISNFEEAKMAKEMGFDLVIIDHHQILDGLPDASIIVDPKQDGDGYPFKGFANAGIVFRLSQLILGKNFSESVRNSFLELTALATIADMMPVEEDNKGFIDEGLNALRNTFRPAINAFFEILESKSNIQKIISALNTCEMVDHVNEAYLLLTSPDIVEAKKIAANLLQRDQEEKTRIKEIIREVEGRINNQSENIIFEGDALWRLVFAGAVASNICQKYQKPTFIFKKGEDESCGSVRVPKDLNSVDAMATCSSLLITYGGHPPASGFRIKNDNLERFKNCLSEYFKKQK
ncbi:MAG: DHH family phosphoesterase [Candidatus Staskawiczbacteria bacterium]|jgi:single-stranded-DNA-specific exonuclease